MDQSRAAPRRDRHLDHDRLEEELMVLVTGASGALGGLILDRLATVPGMDVVAGSSSADGGTRRIDFDEPSTLVDGFGGVDVLVFVSAGFAEDDVCLPGGRPAGVDGPPGIRSIRACSVRRRELEAGADAVLDECLGEAGGQGGRGAHRALIGLDAVMARRVRGRVAVPTRR
jgi:hypothetical protein